MGISQRMNDSLFEKAGALFRSHFGHPHSAAAYAPGRVEVLGNHTDYNEGFVLSAAIDRGTFFLARKSSSPACRLLAGDVREEARFPMGEIHPGTSQRWSNYVKGVVAQLRDRFGLTDGFEGLFLGNVPLGAGLSSSAALEISTGLALARLYNVDVPPLEMARIGQKAEHDFAGAKCGLLDQVTSLFGRQAALVMTDFRTLAVESVPLGAEWCFLICNTAVKHSLVDSEYNERRRRCEEATLFFAGRLPHPVRALRDVSWDEFEAHRGAMDPITARRAAHVIGENTRVLKARQLLTAGQVAEFGTLMFESHVSSQTNFENSCPELDRVVEAARANPEVLGARLSGGGFGGSVVLLAPPRSLPAVSSAISAAYKNSFGHACEIMTILPVAGAHIL